MAPLDAHAQMDGGMMRSGLLLVFCMSFFILCPVLEIGGHFVYLPEAFLYAGVFVAGVLSLLNRPMFPEKERGATRGFQAHISYALLFLCTSLLTASFVGESINNYDIFILRNIVQVFICLKFFDNLISRIDNSKKLDFIIFIVILIISIPAILVYLQRIDIYSIRQFIIDIYKTQFSYLGSKHYESYRYASVFKDFFTAAVYFTILSSFIFFFSLRTTLSIGFRVTLICLLALVYGAQFFVARTSLVMIPLLVVGVALIGVPWSIGILGKRVLPAFVMIAAAGVVASVAVMESGLVKMDWAMEAQSFFTSAGRDKSSSLLVMQQWYEGYFHTLYTKNTARRDYSLFVPYHSYNITERTSVRGLYSDSFYLQEIYRYGIYGIVSYLIYLILMLKDYVLVSRYVIICILTLAFLNIKGGNTFFMSKNIYLYAFIFSVVPYIEHRRS